MTKMLRIEDCRECCHVGWLDDLYRCQYDDPPVFRNRPINDKDFAIPDWCPLDDVPSFAAIEAQRDAAVNALKALVAAGEAMVADYAAFTLEGDFLYDPQLVAEWDAARLAAATRTP